MITRRNIRIKAFQTIYELSQQNETTTKPHAIKYFDEKLEETNALFASVSHLIYSIADYVLVHANQKASKHLPTTADLNVSVKLASNQIVLGLKRNTRFADAVKKYKITHLFEDNMVKKLFLIVESNPIYIDYLANPTLTLENDRKVIDMMLNVCVFDNANTISFLSEKYMNLYNDDDIIRTGMERLFNSPTTFNYTKLISADKHEYAHDLIACYYDKKDILFELIEPKLNNWDAERIAIIDKVLLHLAISEMLYFPTIPLKVTINEYIDLAKAYSTPQSGQFVNGLLDNVRKDLERENKIFKQDFEKK
jgi:transcription antitermination protein NusB